MGRIYFHSQNSEKDVVISGRERAYAGLLVNDLFWQSLNVQRTDHSLYQRWKPIINDEYLHKLGLEVENDPYNRMKIDHFIDTFRINLLYGPDADNQLFSDKPDTVFETALNTALVIGSNPVKFLARLHAQCEIHGYVEGINREWLANIIQQGLDTSVIRDDENWNEIIDFLTKRNDEPVVMSFSVCEGFPNSYVAEWKDNNDGEDWYDISREDRWDLALKGLRKNNSSCEIKPDNWDNYYFGTRQNGYTLVKYVDNLLKDKTNNKGDLIEKWKNIIDVNSISLPYQSSSTTPTG